MHKSKLYDMAAKIAVDKLAPKPIHIAISMQGGGSLSSIELPVIKRVSGGDIGDDGSFIGGYTDADAGVEATVSDTFYGDASTDNETATVIPAGVRVKPRNPRGEGWESLLPPQGKSPQQKIWDNLGIWRGMGMSPQAMGTSKGESQGFFMGWNGNVSPSIWWNKLGKTLL